MARTASGNKIIIEGIEQGSVFPIHREETLKEIMVDGRKTPFDVKGGIYSPNLVIVGQGITRGPVFASENLRLEMNTDKGRQIFLSGLSAYRSITANPLSKTDIDQSPAATIEGIRFVIRGDVTATQKVILRNALIIGSISAPSVEIQNCIVLGSIFADKFPGHIHAICSCFGIYEAKKIVIEGPTTLTVAGGASENEPELIDHLQNPGRNYPLAIRLLPLCRTENVGCGIRNKPPEKLTETPNKEEYTQNPGISCIYWLHQICGHKEAVSLCKADFIPVGVNVEEQSPNTYSIQIEDADPEANTGFRTQAGETYWVLGVQGRAVHLKVMEKSNKTFEEIIQGIFAYEHLDPDARKDLKVKWEVLSRDEQRLLKMATDGLESQV
jgi:hypothetical protein